MSTSRPSASTSLNMQERMKKFRRGDEAYDPESLPHPLVLIGYWIFVLTSSFVFLSLTAYTYNLDDIKIPGLFIGGGLCLLMWAILWTLDLVDSPPRIVWISYLAYLVVCVMSTLLAADVAEWVGWYYVRYNISLLGFVLLGSAVVQTRRMAEWSLKYWVAISLITTTLGLIHYSGLLEKVYALLWAGTQDDGTSRFRALIRTFMNSREMLSTILNVQFFGNFLLMVLPVTAACVLVVFRNLKRRLEAGESTVRPITWSVISGLSVVFALACIFTTFSKSSIFFLPVLIVTFVACVYLFGNVRRIPHLGLMILLGALMAATVLFFTWSDLKSKFVDIGDSTAPRKIIFGGAWSIFQAFPFFGGGPGSFRIYFPEFRSPDYHLTRISNVTLYAHNWLLDLLAQTGALGTLAYLVFLGSLVVLGYIAVRRCPDVAMRVGVIGCVIGVFSLLAGSSLTPMSSWPVGSVALHTMIGTTIGIIMMALRPAEPGVSPATQRRLPMAFGDKHYARGAVFLLVLGFFVHIVGYGTNLFKAAYWHNEGMMMSENLPLAYQGDGGVLKDPIAIQLFQRAEKSYLKSLEYDPTRTTTYYKLAHVYNRLGNMELSLKAYKDLQKYAPDYAEIHYNLAVLHYNEAVAARNQLAKAETPEEKEALRAAMNANFQYTRDEFDRAAKLSNKITVHFFKGNAYFLSADQMDTGSPEAKELFAKAGDILLNINSLPVATVIQEEGQVEREEDQRFRAVALAMEAYARAEAWDRAADAAILNYRAIPTAFPGLKRCVEYLQKASRQEEALSILDEALSKNPLSSEILILKADTLIAANDPSKAEDFGKYVLLLNAELKDKGIALLSDRQKNTLRDALAKLSKPEAADPS